MRDFSMSLKQNENGVGIRILKVHLVSCW